MARRHTRKAKRSHRKTRRQYRRGGGPVAGSCSERPDPQTQYGKCRTASYNPQKMYNGSWCCGRS